MLQQIQDITSFEDLDECIRIYTLDRCVSPEIPLQWYAPGVGPLNTRYFTFGAGTISETITNTSIEGKIVREIILPGIDHTLNQVFMTPIEAFSIDRGNRKMDLVYVTKCGVGIFPTLVEIEFNE